MSLSRRLHLVRGGYSRVLRLRSRNRNARNAIDTGRRSAHRWPLTSNERVALTVSPPTFNLVESVFNRYQAPIGSSPIQCTRQIVLLKSTRSEQRGCSSNRVLSTKASAICIVSPHRPCVNVVIKALSPRANIRSLMEGVALLRQHSRLILEMTKRDLGGRHKAQIAGGLWIFAHPLSMALLYVFLFGVVFKVRFGEDSGLPLDFTTYILSGLIPWLSFQTALGAVCGSILSNQSLVKQFIFPLEVLPVKDVLVALIIWIVGILTLIVYVVFAHGNLTASYLLLPILFVLQAMAMIGIGFALSAATVFFRDLGEFVRLFTLVGVFLMPVVYLPDMVPALFRPILYINPFSYMAWAYQDALYFGRIEHPLAWLIFAAWSFLSFAIGYRIFRRLKPLFGSVL